MQRELPVMGDARRDVVRVDEAMIAACEDIRDAVDLCLKHAGLTQRGIAAQINVDESYISLMFRGKRYWTEEVLAAITFRTGCAAIVQYLGLRIGYQLARPDELREAQHPANFQRRATDRPHSKRLPGRVAV